MCGSIPPRLLSIFERRSLRYIFGPVEENGTWRRRYNHELYKLFNKPDITGYTSIKVKRLEWPRHLIRTGENRCIKKILTPNQKELGKWEDQN
jgi:hypothetical protein